jgi:hypothetical protein
MTMSLLVSRALLDGNSKDSAPGLGNNKIVLYPWEIYSARLSVRVASSFRKELT